MAAQSLSATSIIRPEYKQPTRNSLSPHKTLQSQWLGTISRTNLSLQSSSNLRPFFTRRLRIYATSSLALPTAKPDRVANAEKIPKWSQKAIKSFAMSEMQAWKMKLSTTGTEALVMGIIDEGTSFASRYLRANGFTLAKVRDEIIKLLGEPDRTKFTPLFPPLAEAAQEALDWAVDEKLKSGGDGEITTIHMLLGVWQHKESPGHQVMAALGFSDEKAKVLQDLISKSGFVDE